MFVGVTHIGNLLCGTCMFFGATHIVTYLVGLVCLLARHTLVKVT